MKAMEISATGLNVEWHRLEVIAENIANINTTRTATGEPYQPKRLVSGPASAFASFLNKDPGTDKSALNGVMIYGIENMDTPGHKVHEPAHPHADANGDVTMPGVDLASEMTLMIKTSRAYESNIVMMNIARQMYSKALTIGRSS